MNLQSAYSRPAQGRMKYIPSVIVNAMRNRLNGGNANLAFSLAKNTESITYGATILKIYGQLSSPWYGTKASEILTNSAAIRKGLNMGTRRYTGSR